MKKSIILISLMGLFAWSCNKENVSPVQNEASNGWRTITLNVSADAEITKTAYAGEKTFTWSDGDQISVLFHKGTDDQFYTFTAGAGGSASATFTGSVPTDYEIGASDTGIKWALYPANSGHEYVKTAANANLKVRFNLPSEIDFTESHYSANIPMIAQGDGDNAFAFSNIAAAYKFTFKVADGISKVRMNVTNTANSYWLSGKMPYRASDLFLAFESRSEAGCSGSTSVSLVAETERLYDSVKAEYYGQVSFYVPFRHAGSFKPKLSVYNEDNGFILFDEATFKANATLSEKSHITVLPTADLIEKGLGKPFNSKWDINWQGVATSASGRSDSPYDGISVLKATSDDTNLYIYFEVKKSSTYPNIEYSHANQLTIYLGDEGSTTDHYWQWTTKYSKHFSGWLLQDGKPDYVTYDATLAGSTSVEAKGVYYYEIGIPRSIDACLAGTSATVCIEANQKYVEGSWKGEDTQIGFAPTTGGPAMTVTMTALP